MGVTLIDWWVLAWQAGLNWIVNRSKTSRTRTSSESATLKPSTTSTTGQWIQRSISKIAFLSIYLCIWVCLIEGSWIVGICIGKIGRRRRIYTASIQRPSPKKPNQRLQQDSIELFLYNFFFFFSFFLFSVSFIATATVTMTNWSPYAHYQWRTPGTDISFKPLSINLQQLPFPIGRISELPFKFFAAIVIPNIHFYLEINQDSTRFWWSRNEPSA